MEYIQVFWTASTQMPRYSSFNTEEVVELILGKDAYIILLPG